MKTFNAMPQSQKEFSLFFFRSFAPSRLIIFFLFLFTINAFSENPEISKAREIIAARGEVVVQFHKPSGIPVQQISNLIYIDKVKNDTIRAYINKNQLDNFLNLGIDFNIVMANYNTQKNQLTGSIWNFNLYPTFPEYISMMDSFAKAFPKLCSEIEIGKSVSGRSILFIRINPDTLKPKPTVMYSSTMHGDEPCGYILMLHFIDYLLNNYKKDILVTKLVDSLDIWINPLANPDGTYAGGDNTVFGATRTNADGVDLNRNFPDPMEGIHPDGLPYQPETIEMMNLMKQHHFSLSANFHTGSEVVNYPWDSNYSLHVDNDWFKFISQEFADSVQHYGRSGYFTDVESNGITDGADWYIVYGGRQDYITNFQQGREVTIEIDEEIVVNNSISKISPEDSLINLWNYNYRSFLDYLEQAMYGIHGIVTDSLTGKPIRAKIELPGHDNDSSVIYSGSNCGDYYRLVSSGTYNIQFSATGYISKEISNVTVNNRQATHLNVLLNKGNIIILQNLTEHEFSIYPNPCKDFLNVKADKINSANIEIIDITGKKRTMLNNANLSLPLNTSQLNPGFYLIKVQTPVINFIKAFTVLP